MKPHEFPVHALPLGLIDPASWGDLLARGIAATWLVVCTTIAAYALARRLVPTLSRLDRWLATAIVGTWLATFGFHALSALRRYNLAAALVACGALAAAAFAFDPQVTRRLARELLGLRRMGVLALRGPHRLWVGTFVLCALPVVIRATAFPPLGWDALTYHALKAGKWIQADGALHMRAPGLWSMTADRWGGASVLMSWAMLPFRSDLLASCAEVLQWLFLGLSLVTLARALGAREPHASAAAAFVLAIPTVRLLVGSGYGEPLTCLYFAAACTFAVRAIDTRRVGCTLLAFACVGLALGAKFNFARASIALLVTFAVLLVHQTPLARLPRAAGLLALSMVPLAAVVAPWALRSAQATGLPLSPLPVSVFGITLGVAPPELLWFMDRPLLQGGFHAELRALATMFADLGGEREVPTMLALLPFSVAPMGLVALFHRRRRAAWLLLPALLADLWTYASPELRVVRLRYPESASRFLLVTLMLATVLSAVWAARSRGATRRFVEVLRVASLVLMLRYAWVGWSWVAAKEGALIVGIFALVLAASSASARLTGPLRWAARTIVAAGLLIALDTVRTTYRYDVMATAFAVHRNAAYWVPAARALDDPERPRVIAVTGGPQQDSDLWFAYPFLGRRLQNRLEYVTPFPDGRIHSYGGAALNREFLLHGDPTLWLKRLRRTGVTHVVSFHPPSWELMVMTNNPRIFRRLSDPSVDTFGAFELLPARHPRSSSTISAPRAVRANRFMLARVTRGLHNVISVPP